MAEFLSLREAVDRFVSSGDTVALEGFTHLIPTAAAHELIRQDKKDLTLVRMTPDLVYDLLIGAGCARKLVFSWGGNPGVGSLHRLRDAVEKQWPQPLEKSKSTAMPTWPMPMWLAPLACRLLCCAPTWVPTCPRSTR